MFFKYRKPFYLLLQKIIYKYTCILEKLCACVFCKKPCTSTICNQCKCSLSVFESKSFIIYNKLLKEKTQYQKENSLQVFSLWEYDDKIQKLFLLYKKKGLHIISYQFALLIYDVFLQAVHFLNDKSLGDQIHISKNNLEFSSLCIIPLPTHKKHKKELGFNHTAKISKIIAYQLQCVHAMPLFRISSEMQKKLNAEARWDNMKNALKIKFKKNIYKQMQDIKTIILFDDVVTTGATMYAAYELVQSVFPNTHIIGISLARVV